ncbi:uncharacterized protein LOC131882047 isoform X3 [Tigriopus californicus]|uniref:uncharacterized protein LOC131882047 isoform X3 n=1 Tax=Tigriopus californicus TaxID=6832 RepID=UPI0027D9FC55|nr:uncharacterized protein LOC131882047 isoform X3 [Tigriopus californicus]
MTNDCTVLDRSCNDCQASELACAIDQAYILTFEIKEQTDKPKKVPFPSIYPKPSKNSKLISLLDGRIWMYDYQNQKTFLFNGETFVPSVQPLWVKGDYGMCMQTIGRVHDGNIVAVGGWRYNLELKEKSKTRERSVYVLDMKKNVSKS